MSRRTKPAAAPTAARPDGLAERHLLPSGHGASLASLGVLLALVAWGASGWAGGRDEHPAVRTPEVSLEVTSPAWIRSGEVYEQRVRVTALRRIERFSLAYAPELLRQVTVNAMTPEPAEQQHAAGRYRFAWQHLEAGQVFELKLDAQINPALWGRNDGRLAVLDGERELASVPLAMNVLP